MFNDKIVPRPTLCVNAPLANIVRPDEPLLLGRSGAEDAVAGGVRLRQHGRFKGQPRVTCNARRGPKDIKRCCALDEPTKTLLQMAMTGQNLSARAHGRILKVARTIADLANSDRLTADHIGEAIQFRSLDRQIWG
ncbi:MAG: hypothetical protein MUE94_07155 [Verrucomicrobia bacterium]|nr:hypothetical protein [Verrucomicrobiota bacterium]